MSEIGRLLAPIRALHACIRDAVLAASERAAEDELSRIASDGEGDTIYAIDRVSEETLVGFVEREIAPRAPVVLIAEGLAGGKIVLPRGAAETDAVWRIIVDPIDGTRGLMFQKRSGWILTGVAPNRGPQTSLADIELAVQTEIPILKQHLCDSAWAIRGQGAQAERMNRLTGEISPLALRPSRARTIAHGFATVARFFPCGGVALAEIEEEIARAALGPIQPGKAPCFEDQYISTGGQLFELMCGHDRFIADLRPLMQAALAQGGEALGLCCHPYDLCTELIARELGVIVTNERGGVSDAPLAVEPDVCWIGYANEDIRAQIEPLLQSALMKKGALS